MTLPDLLVRSATVRRQGLLFLVAIVVPSLLLAGLSLRMLTQERELADKRVTDERRRVAESVHQQLLARLEALKREALGQYEAAAGVAQGSAVALIAPIDHDRILLPWEHSHSAQVSESALTAPLFAETIRQGELQEYRERQFESAANAYRRAASVAVLPSQQAFAQLALARVFVKAGRMEEAAASRDLLLALPLTAVDDEGIPFCLYAVRSLLGSPQLSLDGAARATNILGGVLGVEAMTPPALYMVGELLDRLGRVAGQERQDEITRLRMRSRGRLDDLEQAEALQNAFPAIVTALAQSDHPTWMPFGSDARLWLVGRFESPHGDSQIALAVRAASLMAALVGSSQRDAAGEGEKPILTRGPNGEPLGRDLPGLALSLPASATSALMKQAVLQRTFYSGALALVLGVTLCGGYFFWRDIQRDLRMSSLRAQFVASVSHELKTPLTAIRMFAETLRMGRSASATAREEYLETIVHESERLTRLLDNVLDFSKIEQGRKAYHFRTQPLQDVVRSAARTMQYPLAQQGFDLHVEIDDDIPDIAVDADALEQAVLNLLTNAMKYSGSPRVVKLRLTRQSAHAVIEVTDAGCGIAASEQTRIFEKFYRGPEHHSIPGTGLGLTLVDHTARAHGGTVAVRSAPGAGSTFAIRLPGA